MSSSLLEIEARLQATRDAQTTIAADWVWEEMTVVQWDTQVTGFDTRKAAAVTQEGVMLNARASYEGSIDQLHGKTVLALKLARIKWRDDAPRRTVLSTLHASGKARDSVEKEAQAFAAVWAEFDAAWAPDPLGALADFNTLLTTCFTQENTYKKEHTRWREMAEEFNDYAGKSEDLCQAWYAVATAVFPAGTAHGDMIRGTIDTGSPTPPPEYYEIDVLEDQGGGTVGVTYVAGGGAHATTLTLLWRETATEVEFVHNAPLLPGGQTVNGLTPGATYEFKTRAQNSTGTVDSPTKQVTTSA